MTVRELRLLMKYLPPNLEVVIELEDGNFASPCPNNTDVSQIEDLDGVIFSALILAQCTCVEIERPFKANISQIKPN